MRQGQLSDGTKVDDPLSNLDAEPRTQMRIGLQYSQPELGETLGFESVDASLCDETGKRIPLGDEPESVTAC